MTILISVIKVQKYGNLRQHDNFYGDRLPYFINVSVNTLLGFLSILILHLTYSLLVSISTFNPSYARKIFSGKFCSIFLCSPIKWLKWVI